MKKRILLIFFVISILLLLLTSHVKAVTEKQRAVGQMIADFAVNTAVNYTSDFAYTYWLRGVSSSGEFLRADWVDGEYQQANFLGIRFSGNIYGALPKEAGIIGTFEEKFPLYCGPYCVFATLHAIGGQNPDYEFVTNKSWTNFLPGDYVTVIYDPEGGGHAFIYVDDAGDDNQYTIRVADCSGSNPLNYRILTYDKDWSIQSIRRVSENQADKLSYNIINASLDLYDRLDHTSPSITQVSVQTGIGSLNIIAEDKKPNNYENTKAINSSPYIKQPVSEPANCGIVAYQITSTNVEPIANWIEVEKTENLDIITKPITKPGTYYAWILDVGGNTSYKEVSISSTDVTLTNVYNLSDETISGIQEKTQLADFAKNITSGIRFDVITQNGDKLQENELIGTKMILKIENGPEYTIIVDGDLTGDGNITTTDLIKLKKSIVSIEVLDNDCTLAGDLDKNEKITPTDLLLMKKAIVNLN